MNHGWLVRMLCFLTVTFLWTTPSWAFKRELRLPLFGCRGHFAASGSARHVEVRGEPNVKDHDVLSIDVKNVPLPPGTVLAVQVNDEVIGNITLNERQSGKLRLTSLKRKNLPKLDWGTSVNLKKIDGSLVTW
ncbi:hypothetical protein [Schlesneria paludicola]|uniref:hypothetical protein n=1 Tax=Schlesneria paludicola TaxID=360056 RepID=UPI00029A0AFF|nr:hypothetical protein [Schlesneria paludicola]